MRNIIVGTKVLEEILESAIEDSCVLLAKHVSEMGKRADAYTVSLHRNQLENCIALMMQCNPSYDKRPVEKFLEDMP